MRTETRKCLKCGEIKDILQRFKHSTNICKECTKERAKFYQKRAAERKGKPKRDGLNGRIPYPLTIEHKTPSSKFRKIASKMMKLKCREEWIEQIRKNYSEIAEDVLVWIYRHGNEKPEKRITKIKRDYPDTRYMTWEEYEKGLGDSEEDS